MDYKHLDMLNNGYIEDNLLHCRLCDDFYISLYDDVDSELGYLVEEYHDHYYRKHSENGS